MNPMKTMNRRVTEAQVVSYLSLLITITHLNCMVFLQSYREGLPVKLVWGVPIDQPFWYKLDYSVT